MGQFLKLSAIPSPQMVKGLRRELSHTVLRQPPPHPGTSLFCPPDDMKLEVPENSSLKGKTSYSPKGPSKGKESGGEGGFLHQCSGSSWQKFATK